MRSLTTSWRVLRSSTRSSIRCRRWPRLDRERRRKDLYVQNRRRSWWTDGKPLTAGDFQYSWKRLSNPETGADYAYFLYDIVNAEEYNTGGIKRCGQDRIKVVDDGTLEVTLKKPAAYFPSLLSFMATYPMRKTLSRSTG
ncbi:MAG: ABC transporter substrate-binding protein [Thermodesulfobacteriota bacterium]